MDWKNWVSDEPLISEKAKDYFAEAKVEKRIRTGIFQYWFDNGKFPNTKERGVF